MKTFTNQMVKREMAGAVRLSLVLAALLGSVNGLLAANFSPIPFTPAISPTLSPASGTNSPVIRLPAGVTSRDIQRALDALPASGGEVRLPAGRIEVFQPIVLRRNGQTLRGAGDKTVLHLAAGADCPVIILGEPVNHPAHTISHLEVADLLVDGNRAQQTRELWRLTGEGSEIRNNGVTVQDVSDSLVRAVTCARCRSGGLVTTLGVTRLTVADFDSFNNQFDGLACYVTTDSLFTNLNLHDNPGAGISLDLGFEHNVVSNATLSHNDLGIFMRASRNNQFHSVTISNSHHFGVFMAQADLSTPAGIIGAPDSECTRNAFTNLVAVDCGSAAFRVNDFTCTNNVIIQPRFLGLGQTGVSEVRPDLVSVR